MNIQLQILQLGLGLQDMNGMILVLRIISNLTRWYLDIAKREAVIRGYDLLKNKSEIPTNPNRFYECFDFINIL